MAGAMCSSVASSYSAPELVSSSTARQANALFINSGILGHASVHLLIKGISKVAGSLVADHLNLSTDLTIKDRLIRRFLSLRLPGPAVIRRANLDLARWRQEMNVGWLAARRIRQMERRHGRYKVLHFHPQATAYASVRRMRETPSIVSIDCTQTLASLEDCPTIRRITYRPSVIHDGCVFRAAASIIATSKWAADDLAHQYPDCASKVRVMPYPIRAELFDPAWIEERAERIRRDPEAPVRVLFLGGDFERKGGHELLEAWRQRDGACRAELRLVTCLPAGLELPAGVSILPAVKPYSEAWRQLWRECDLFVMPTRHEAFGMVFQEAAAAGVPCIGTRISAIPEIVEDGKTGMLVSVGDQAQLVQAMNELIASPEKREEMGRAGRIRAESIWDPDRYLGDIHSLMVSLLDQSTKT